MAYLLDEHISPAVAGALRRAGIEAHALKEFRGGLLVGAGDVEIIRCALEAGLVFVTFDVHTIPPLLRYLADTGFRHGGVVLVSYRTFRQGDVRGLARALAKLHQSFDEDGGMDRVVFLARETR